MTQEFLKTSKKYIVEFLVLSLILSVLTVIFTWPLAQTFSKEVPKFIDNSLVVYIIESNAEKLLQGELNNYWTSNMFHPYERTGAFTDHFLTLTLLSLPALIFTGSSIMIENYLIFISFVFTGLTGYYLYKYYLKDSKASFIAAFILTFSVYHISKVIHIHLASYYLIPILLLALEKILEENRVNKFAITTFILSFVLNAFISVHLMTMAVIILPIIVIASWYKDLYAMFFAEIGGGLRDRVYSFWNTHSLQIISLLICILVSSLLLLPSLNVYLELSENHNIVRDLESIGVGSAEMRDYLITGENHWLMGERTSSLLEEREVELLPEKQLYIGFTTLILSCVALLRVQRIGGRIKIYFNLSENKMKYLAVVIIGFVLSFGPYLALPVDDYEGFRLPYYYLYQLLPTMKAVRVPARFYTLFLIGISLLAGYGYREIHNKLKNSKLLVTIFFIVCVWLLTVERLSIPIVTEHKVEKSLLTEELSSDRYNGKNILHYPVQYGNYDHMNYLRYTPHSVKTVNGYSGFEPDFFQQLQLLYSTNSREETIKALQITASADVDYLIIHEELRYVRSGNFDHSERFALLRDVLDDSRAKLIFQNNGAFIYSLEPFVVENWRDGKTEITATLVDEDIIISERNEKNIPIVREHPERYVIYIRYKINGFTVRTIRKEILRPLYIEEEGLYETKVDLPNVFPLFYDEVDVTISGK